MKNERKVSIERPLKKVKRRFDVGINYFHNGVVVLNCAGSCENLDGWNNKYKQMARFMQKKEIGTVVRIGNEFTPDLPWPNCVMDDFRYLIDHTLKNGEQLSGVRDPKLYLMGYSTGAGIVAAIGHEYPSVEKMLLIALGSDCGRRKIERGLEAYTGEVYIVIGENDHDVGTKSGRTLYKLAKNASKRELREIPNCTHDFEGETNSRILSKTPLWAFAGDESFPSPEGGIIMYDKGKGPFVPTSYHIDPVTRKLIEHEK